MGIEDLLNCDPMLFFFLFSIKLRELLVLFAPHKCFPHFEGSIVTFHGCWLKIIPTKISSCVKVFNFENLARPLFIFNFIFVFEYFK